MTTLLAPQTKLMKITTHKLVVRLGCAGSGILKPGICYENTVKQIVLT